MAGSVTEDLRLDALRSLDLAAIADRAQFTRITMLASTVLGAPGRAAFGG
ncbi:hypothetical protein [Erythrobacter sp. WG]|nr:hypothetical protein [Erythrobacter sp. WG]MCX9148736.1 hypothetical protein [Erythrobacter sp. WG]